MKTILVSLTFFFAFSSFALHFFTTISFNDKVTIKILAPRTFEIKHYDDNTYPLKARALTSTTFTTCSVQKWSYVKFNPNEFMEEQNIGNPLTLYVTGGEILIKPSNTKSSRLKKGQSYSIAPLTSFILKNNSSSDLLRFFIHNSSIEK